MKRTIKKELETYTELHWWNGGKKTLDYKGDLKGLLEHQNITFTKKKTEHNGIYEYRFKSDYGIKYETTGTISDFRHLAKQMVQMELVRMGDKAQLYVYGTTRPYVTVNF